MEAFIAKPIICSILIFFSWSHSNISDIGITPGMVRLLEDNIPGVEITTCGVAVPSGCLTLGSRRSRSAASRGPSAGKRRDDTMRRGAFRKTPAFYRKCSARHSLYQSSDSSRSPDLAGLLSSRARRSGRSESMIAGKRRTRGPDSRDSGTFSMRAATPWGSAGRPSPL